MNHGFVRIGELGYKREINDIVQMITVGFHKAYKRISMYYRFNELMSWSYNFQIEEYYFETEEEFEKLLDELVERLEKVIIPYYDECANEFSITRTMVRRVKEETEKLVNLYLKEYHQFPRNIEELMQNVRDYYHRYKSEDEEKNQELICVVSAVYYRYLLQLPIPFEIRTDEENTSLSLGWFEKKESIIPIFTAFKTFIIDDYDEFKAHGVVYLTGEIGKPQWEKKEKWEQIIF